MLLLVLFVFKANYKVALKIFCNLFCNNMLYFNCLNCKFFYFDGNLRYSTEYLGKNISGILGKILPEETLNIFYKVF